MLAKATALPGITIIGGGIGGCYTGLRLAEAGHHVTIIDIRDELLAGTSDGTPGRIGLGFHYRHLETAKTYLRATIAFARSSLLDSSGKLKFVIGGDEKWEHPFRHGRYFITKDSQVPVKELLSVYEAVQEEYRTMCREDPRNKVFGEPDEFFRILELSEYDKDVNTKNIEIGIETNEHLLDWPAFKKDLLRKIDRNNNIKVITGQKVVGASDSANGRFHLVTQDKDGKECKYETLFVVNAAWENIESIDKGLGFTDQDIRTNRMKLLAEVELPESMKNKHSMFFAVGPHAMFSNIGNGIGRITSAKVTNYSDSTDIEIPKEYNALLYEGDIQGERKNYFSEKGKQIISGAADYIPELQKAKLLRIFAGIVKSKGTVDIDDPASKFHERNYSGVEVLKKGWVRNACMKLCYCEKNAQEIVSIVQKHQLASQKLATKEFFKKNGFGWVQYIQARVPYSRVHY